MPKFGTNNAMFRYFRTKIFKKYCHIWNQHPRIRLIRLIAKFCEKMKMPYLGIFGPKFFKKYVHIWNQHPRVGQICLIAKFCEKTKISKSGTKNALFRYFWAIILKKLLSYLKSAPRICQIWVFNSWSEFWYRFHFF